MLLDALRYPTRGSPSLAVAGIVVAMAIGYRYTVAFVPSVVALVPGLATVIALLVLIGYLSNVLVTDSQRPPQIDVSGSFKDGIVSFGITVIFLVVPIALLVTTIWSFTEAGSDAGEGVPAVFLVSSTASLFLFLACAYVLPAALAARAETGRMRAAFDRNRLQPVLRELPYVTAWTTGFALVVIGFVPVSITLGSADVTGLVSSVFGAYFVLAGSRIVGTGYRRATPKR